MSKLTRKQAKEVRTPCWMRDWEISFEDAPELTHWDRAVVGKFYRPTKKPLTIRIAVLAWLKYTGLSYLGHGQDAHAWSFYICDAVGILGPEGRQRIAHGVSRGMSGANQIPSPRRGGRHTLLSDLPFLVRNPMAF